MGATGEPACFWPLSARLVDKVPALIFKQFQTQFDPSVIIIMQELEILLLS